MVESVDETYTDADLYQLNELIAAMKSSYGKDFSHYTKSSVFRRVMRRKNLWNLANIGEMVPLITNDPCKWQVLFNDLSTSVTQLYRDPFVFKCLQEEVFPVLATFPFFKIWVAGCSTGEEVYSLAILLHEQDLLKRARIYGTDFNDSNITKAKDGIYNLSAVADSQTAFNAAGGRKTLTDYFHVAYGKCKAKPFITKNITFANHNLTSDGVFGEVELVLCRNVLIYFDKSLKQRALTLFDQSLYPGGFLTLGTHESIMHQEQAMKFTLVDRYASIYRKQLPTND
ncbi:CheR family methyltransferase [Thalassotalea fusca]